MITVENEKPVPPGHPDWRDSFFLTDGDNRKVPAGVLRMIRGRGYKVRRIDGGVGNWKCRATGANLPALLIESKYYGG